MPVQQSSPFVQSALSMHEADPPQWFFCPPPPHVAGAVQVPQSSVWPQPSDSDPQFASSAAHVVGTQVLPPPAPLGIFVQAPFVHASSEPQSPSALHATAQTPVGPHTSPEGHCVLFVQDTGCPPPLPPLPPPLLVVHAESAASARVTPIDDRDFQGRRTFIEDLRAVSGHGGASEGG